LIISRDLREALHEAAEDMESTSHFMLYSVFTYALAHPGHARDIVSEYINRPTKVKNDVRGTVMMTYRDRDAFVNLAARLDCSASMLGRALATFAAEHVCMAADILDRTEDALLTA